MPVLFLPGAQRSYLKLQKGDREALRARLEAIGADPGANHGASVKPLKGDPKGRFRVRHGDYRAIYMIQPIGIVVIAVGHRKDIYE